MTATSTASVRNGRVGARAGVTLLELMIAIAVLTMALGSVMSHWATMHLMRRTTTHMAQAQEVLRALSERFAGWDPYALGPVPTALTAVAPWSLPRFVGGLEFDAIPGPDDALPMNEEDLLDPLYGPILESPIGVPDLEVFCEYYRYEPDIGDPANPLDDRNGLLDLIDPATARPGDFTERFQRNNALRLASAIDPLIPPILDVADHQMFIVRLVVRWENGQYVESFLAKRRIPRTQ